MKKLIALFLSLFIEFYSCAALSPAYASSVCPPGFENLCKIDVSKNPNIFGNVVQIVILAAIILSVIFLIWGAMKWIMSGGDKGKIDQARSAIIASIVGLIISLLAYFIITLILYLLTGSNELNLTFPKLV